MWWSDYWPAHWMFFAPVMVLIFAVVCAALMFLAMRGQQRGGHALDILEERYARGEIDQAEFEKRRRFLEVTTK